MAGFSACSAFSLYVYHDQDQPPLPNGWRILFACPNEFQYDGYYGMAFMREIHEDGNVAYDVVIAHRGAVASNFNDFEILLAKTPAQFKKGAYLFDEYVRQYLDKTYSIPTPQISYVITHTGHSLGAVLAELCVASSVRFLESSGPASGITFESAGSKSIIADMESKGELPADALLWAQKIIITTLADVDAVNTCNEQVALQHYSGDMTSLAYDYEVDSADAGIMPPGITLYALNYTFHDQHKMVKMYRYWQEAEEYKSLNKKSAQDMPWPIGFENGYRCYTNYNLRQAYWDGYIQYIWDKYPEVQQKYNNDFNQWSQFFQSNLILNQATIDNGCEAETKKTYFSATDKFTLFASENNSSRGFVLVDGDEARAEEQKEKNKAAASSGCVVM